MRPNTAASAPQPSSRGEPGDLEDVRRRPRHEGFLGAGESRILVMREFGVDRFRHRLQRIRVIHLHVELRHDAAASAALRRLLHERQVRVGDILILRLIAAEDAGHVHGDPRRSEALARADSPPGGERFAHQRRIGAPRPILN
jgi:hypothetical protein